MNRDITTIPTQELIDDKWASFADIKLCKIALAHGITDYNGEYEVAWRLGINEQIIEAIDKELERRKIETTHT